MCRCYSYDFKRSTSSSPPNQQPIEQGPPPQQEQNSSPPSYAIAPETITLLQSSQLTEAQFRDLSVIVLQKAAEKKASATSALDRPPTPSAPLLSELSSTASSAPSPS
ncbi:unnamed protein product [Rotaria sp. Silwood1]|nr:unnamed protein product [Rotaria sp. Silwood1]CAF3596196.1 unnamed protein product [Rotaria sp. Silwood1]CAF4977278.1 unnamed protein product [Rotaria sp. Silwood1]CAF5020616.1 unnamed protein product [Rotaria sp. Silwood1]